MADRWAVSAGAIHSFPCEDAVHKVSMVASRNVSFDRTAVRLFTNPLLVGGLDPTTIGPNPTVFANPLAAHSILVGKGGGVSAGILAADVVVDGAVVHAPYPET